MPIFRIKQKLVLFLHIPKAGGTSVEEWLSTLGSESMRMEFKNHGLPCVPQHFHGALMSDLFAPGFFDFSFAVSRNPYKRLLSEYNYRMSHRPRRERYLIPEPSFSVWTRYVLWRYAQKPYIYSNHIRPQSEFRIDGTEVFRLEDQIPELTARIAEVCEVPPMGELPRANRSKARETKIDDATAARIYDFYRADFDNFGYERDSYI